MSYDTIRGKFEKLTEESRLNCDALCADWPKPCEFHQGWIDAFEMISYWYDSGVAW